jgi:hypothetical protein
MSSAPEQEGTTSVSALADQKFPVKLHAMLTKLEEEGNSNIASWLPHGRSFMVRDQERFLTEALPKWFKLKKYTSFVR